MEFKDRLLNYRSELKIKTQKGMSEKLGITNTLYCMLENGQRKPSHEVLSKLFLLSDKPEEYWLYGVEDGKEYINAREEFKMIKQAVSQLIEIGLIKDINFDKSTEKVLMAALKADIQHLIEKKQH